MLPIGGRAKSSAAGPGAARGGHAAGGWCCAASSLPIAIVLLVGGRAKSSAVGPWRWPPAAPEGGLEGADHSLIGKSEK
jgi:hypothetical protein